MVAKKLTPADFGFVNIGPCSSLRQTSFYLDPFGRFSLTCTRMRRSERRSKWFSAWEVRDTLNGGRTIGVASLYGSRDAALAALAKFLSKPEV